MNGSIRPGAPGPQARATERNHTTRSTDRRTLNTTLGALLALGLAAGAARGGDPYPDGARKAGPLSVPGMVSVLDGRFTVDGPPFHFAGANCYYLMVYAADPSLRPQVDEVLEETAAMGLTVIRTWAFNDGTGWNALQTSPGVYDESVFEGLDYVLDRCHQLGLRVVLPLVNNWVDYGGMDQYVAWSPTASAHDDFYTDDSCRAWYVDHAAAVIGRVNTRNGRLYRDDPTIFAWELANEPRCPSDRSGATLAAWIADMSDSIRALDPNHLITSGIEGFYDDAGGPWYLNGWEGVDFVRDHQAPGVDYAVAHSWPDNWGLGFSTVMSLVARQIGDAAALGKPFVLEEFGKVRDQASPRAVNHYDPATWFNSGVEPYSVRGAVPVRVDPDRRARLYTDRDRIGPGVRVSEAPAPAPASTATRDAFFSAWFDSLVVHACGGSSYWIQYNDAYPDYDGYGVYYPADTSTAALIEAHARAMAALGESSGVPDPGVPVPQLSPGYPNPFDASVRLTFSLLRPEEWVRLVVIDVAGRRIRTLIDGPLGPGAYEPVWDGTTDRGDRAAAGVYLVRLSVAGASTARRVVMTR
jgi:mannan endo-1,4-beta-mannosidase